MGLLLPRQRPPFVLEAWNLIQDPSRHTEETRDQLETFLHSQSLLSVEQFQSLIKDCREVPAHHEDLDALARLEKFLTPGASRQFRKLMAIKTSPNTAIRKDAVANKPTNKGNVPSINSVDSDRIARQLLTARNLHNNGQDSDEENSDKEDDDNLSQASTSSWSSNESQQDRALSTHAMATASSSIDVMQAIKRKMSIFTSVKTWTREGAVAVAKFITRLIASEQAQNLPFVAANHAVFMVRQQGFTNKSEMFNRTCQMVSGPLATKHHPRTTWAIPRLR